MQAHATTYTRYFHFVNVIISHPKRKKEGLGFLSVCAIASQSSPPSHMCVCNGDLSSELFCGHYNSREESCTVVSVQCRQQVSKHTKSAANNNIQAGYLGSQMRDKRGGSKRKVFLYECGRKHFLRSDPSTTCS
jgi:hypothetical protein